MSNYRCAVCAKSVEIEKHAPRGWKRRGEEYFCGDCWIDRYYLRAITIPVVSPVDCTWEELRTDLRAMWRETTRCSNYMMSECYASDVRRTGAVEEKMPPMSKSYLYPDAREQFPTLPSQTVASIEQSVKRKYKALRYKIVWTGEVSLPTYRYPSPFPVNPQSWTASYGDDGERPHVSIRIGGNRRTLRLKGGAQMHRQKRLFADLVAGKLSAGELAVYRRGKDILVKIVAWLPRPAGRKEAHGTLVVRTTEKALLMAVNGKDEALWTYHGDHLPRWIAAHQDRVQHWADDSKYENRPRPSFRVVREKACEKFDDRMDSAAHEIAYQLVEYSQRRNFAAIKYDDTIQSFCPDFRWAKLRSLIIEKADVYGINVVIASGQPAEETPEVLAEQ